MRVGSSTMASALPLGKRRLGPCSCGTLSSLVFMVLLACTIMKRTEAQAALSHPVLTIDMSHYGYKPVKGNDVQLVFGDITPHLVMFSNSKAILYQTQSSGPVKVTGAGTMTAFIMNVNTGALIRRQEWQTPGRHSVVERKESEARIVALSDDRYAVMADATLYFYDSDGNQLFKRPLGEGMSSMQPTEGGNELLLRHEITIGGESRNVEYSWIDAKTMQVQGSFVDRDTDRSQAGMLGVDRVLVYRGNGGLHALSIDGKDRVICATPSCSERGIEDIAATSDGVAVASRFGVGVVPIDGKQPSWFRETTPNAGMDRVTVIPIETSLDGKYLAAYVSRGHRYRQFDGLELALPSEFFVYSTQDGKRVAIMPGTSAMCAMAPDGSKLISIDGRHLNVYDVVSK